MKLLEKSMKFPNEWNDLKLIWNYMLYISSDVKLQASAKELRLPVIEFLIWVKS